MPAYYPTRTMLRRVPPPRVITLRLPPQQFTQSLTAGLSFIGSLTPARKYFRAFTASFRSDIDLYDVSNADSSQNISDTRFGYAQSFTGNGNKLTRATFQLSKINAPTGNVYAKLYNITGTYGSSSKPIGAALAVSEPIDASSFRTSPTLVTFYFLSNNIYQTTNGNFYCIAVEYVNGNATDQIAIGRDSTSPTHSGNASFLSNTGVWSIQTSDIPFYCQTDLLSGSLAKNTNKTAGAILSFVGDLVTNFIAGGGQLFTQTLTASLSFIGSLAASRFFLKSFTATFSFIGNLAVSKTFVRALTATLSFSGALSRRTGKVLSATLSFVGTIPRNIRKSLSATLSFIGALATSFIAGGGHLFLQSYTATLSFAGAIAKLPQKNFAATLSFIGALAKGIRKAGFTATLSFVGFLSTAKAFLKSLTATLSFSGVLAASKSFLKAFTATLSFTGALSRRAGKAFSATLSVAASYLKRVAHTFSATLAPVGALVKAIRDAGFSATLSFVGNLTSLAVHFFTRSFTAALAFAGNLARSRLFARALSATLNMSGALRRQLGKTLAATLSFSGALRRTIRKGLAAVLSFAVFFFKGGAIEILAGLVTKAGALIALAGSTARISKAGSQLDVVERGSGANIQVTGSNLRVERTK